MEWDRKHASSVAADRTRFPPTSNCLDQLDPAPEQSRATDDRTHVLEETSSLHTLISPPYELFDVPSFGSPFDLFASFAPDLENLVMADYPFETSVSDRNLMQGSGNITYDDIAADIA